MDQRRDDSEEPSLGAVFGAIVIGLLFGLAGAAYLEEKERAEKAKQQEDSKK